jgi:hypothetical protein
MQAPYVIKQLGFPRITMLAGIRFCTAIALIATCAFSVVHGVGIVRFSLANARSSENAAHTIHTWTTVPGIASAALQSELMKKIDPSDVTAANGRRETLGAILAIEPLHSTEWLLLSDVQLRTDQPMDAAFGSLLLSIMTGPNEGYVMTERAIFGASLWEWLSPELKRRAASDLAWGEMPDRKKLGAVLAAKSAGVRSELRTALLATGLPPKQVERRLGF